MVRAKFQVYGKIPTPDGTGALIQMRAVYSEDPNHENKRFWDATPNAHLQMHVKTAAADYFEDGKEYYLDFTQA